MLSIEQLRNKFIAGELNDYLYSAINENGETVTIVTKSDGFEIRTNQLNHWVLVKEHLYDKDTNTWTTTETYDGKWD